MTTAWCVGRSGNAGEWKVAREFIFLFLLQRPESLTVEYARWRWEKQRGIPLGREPLIAVPIFLSEENKMRLYLLTEPGVDFTGGEFVLTE